MRLHRYVKKLLVAVAVLLAAGVGGYVAVRSNSQAVGDERIGTAPNPNDPAASADEKAIREIQAAYVKAFNAGDAKALAKFWTTDGEFVNHEGKTVRGRAALEKDFADFFAEAKGTTLKVSTDTLRFVSPGVALESGTTHLRHPDGSTDVSAYNIVHTRRDGKWQLASVRELPYEPATNYDHLRDLEWMVGTWAAKGKEGRKLEVSCDWTAKRNFFLKKYTVTEPDGSIKTGIHVVGWDPQIGQVRGWVFDSDGGFASEVWHKEPKQWVLEVDGVTRDGAALEATNIIVPVDHNQFTWQSVGRTLNEVELPDTAVLKVTRVMSKAK
jgi:uncharacterized protein (TIGR02246 family)